MPVLLMTLVIDIIYGPQEPKNEDTPPSKEPPSEFRKLDGSYRSRRAAPAFDHVRIHRLTVMCAMLRFVYLTSS